MKDIDNIVMIFEFDKDNIEYQFHSLARAKHIKDGSIEIISGELNGETNLSKLVINPSTFDTKSANGTALISGGENILHIYYSIPKETFDIYPNVQQACVGLCAMGSLIKFKIVDVVDYGKSVLLNAEKHFERYKMNYKLWNEEKEKILKMINDEITVDFNVDEIIGIEPNNPFNKSPREKFDRSSPKVNIGTIGVQREIVETEKSQIKDIDINKIIGEIKEKIVGQDSAIESVVANIYANQIIIESGNKDLISSQKSSILLDGTTGTGKTAIVKEVSDKLSLPIVITSSTEYSSTGYVGSSLTDILVKLLDKANGDLELAERGIVCLDEIDKLAQNSKDNNNLKLKSAVQQELLAFIGGTKFDINYKGRNIDFDTTNITFIAMGAFTKIRDDKIAKINESKKVIGFNTSTDTSDENKYTITEQDYIEYGLQRELVGRFSLLTSTKTYTIEDYKNILLNSSISPLTMFKEFCKGFGIEEVNYDESFIDMMASMAYEDNFGARGLQKIIANLKNTLLLDIINNKTKSIILTTDMLVKVREKNIRTY